MLNLWHYHFFIKIPSDFKLKTIHNLVIVSKALCAYPDFDFRLTFSDRYSEN